LERHEIKFSSAIFGSAAVIHHILFGKSQTFVILLVSVALLMLPCASLAISILLCEAQ
jgi:hypothetical protein